MASVDYAVRRADVSAEASEVATTARQSEDALSAGESPEALANATGEVDLEVTFISESSLSVSGGAVVPWLALAAAADESTVRVLWRVTWE